MHRRLASFDHAGRGVAYLFKTQANARIHLAITAAVVATGVWLGLAARDWAVLALTIGFVLAAEGLNTAVEAVVDLASPDRHPLARAAKDTAAGAVLLAAIAAVVVGVLILGPPLAARLVGGRPAARGTATAAPYDVATDAPGARASPIDRPRSTATAPSISSSASV